MTIRDNNLYIEYHKYGTKELIPVKVGRQEDIDYCMEHNVTLSGEQMVGMPSVGINDDVILYLNDGTTLEDGTPDEIIIFMGTKSPEDTLQEGITKLKERKARGE